MQIDKNVFIPGQKKSLACILILSCDRIHKYLTPASCLSDSGDYLDQPPAQLLLLLHLIWFRKDVMFRMLKIYFQTSRTELAGGCCTAASANHLYTGSHCRFCTILVPGAREGCSGDHPAGDTLDNVEQDH